MAAEQVAWHGGCKLQLLMNQAHAKGKPTASQKQGAAPPSGAPCRRVCKLAPRALTGGWSKNDPLACKLRSSTSSVLVSASLGTVGMAVGVVVGMTVGAAASGTRRSPKNAARKEEGQLRARGNVRKSVGHGCSSGICLLLRKMLLLQTRVLLRKRVLLQTRVR